MAFTAASRPLLFSPRQARNASTQSTLPLDASQAGSTLTDFSGTPVSLTGSDLLDIPEQIGFLKTLGLDFGWGPTSLMQTCLESIYIYTGLPWWASIGVVALAVRLALLKPSLDASENAQKHQELMKDPKYQAAVNEMKAMMISGNHLAGAEARARVSLMNRAVGFSMWKNFVPMLQLPIGIGMFRLIQGMAHLPVPSFETGGALWFTDLAVADPLFILPVLSGILMMMGMRVRRLSPSGARHSRRPLTMREPGTSSLHGPATGEDDEAVQFRRRAHFHHRDSLHAGRSPLILLLLVSVALCPVVVHPPAVVPSPDRAEAARNTWLECDDVGDAARR